MRTLTAIICIFSCLFSSRSVYALDLLGSYQRALQYDPSFKAQSFDHQASQQLPNIARAALLPSLSAGYNLVKNRDEISAPDVPFITQGSARYDSDEYSVNFKQSLYNRSNFARYRLAQTQANVGELEYQAARQQLALTVAERYFAVLSALDSLRLAEAEQLAVARQHDLANERLHVGLGTKTDLYEAQARLRLAEAEQISAANSLQDARRALTELTGGLDSPLSGLNNKLTLPTPQPADPKHWRTQAMSRNLAIKQADANVAAARHTLTASRGGHWPSVDFVVNHANNDSDGSISGPGSQRTATDALLQFNVPIFAGGGISAKSKQDALLLQAAEQRAQSTRQSVNREVQSAYESVTTSHHRSDALRQAVIANESALEAKQEGFDAGLNTNLDVLDAQRELFRAQRDFLQSRYQTVINLLALKQRSGVLSDQDLSEINHYLGVNTTDINTSPETRPDLSPQLNASPTAGRRINGWLTIPANQ